MSEAFVQALAAPGLGWLLATCFVAGVVYGFAGFGAALIFMPVGAIFLPMESAIASFNLAAMASVFTVLPSALRQVDRAQSGTMIAVALPFIALGLLVLAHVDTVALRWGVIAVSSVTLLALMAGWRYRATPGPVTRAGVAAATGLVGGATGLLGPVLILFQLSGQEGITRSRATTLVFLTVTSTMLVPIMAFQGILSASAIALGFLMLVPYGLGTKVGQTLFVPAREEGYRVVAYGIIGTAILLGLPVWD